MVHTRPLGTQNNWPIRASQIDHLICFVKLNMATIQQKTSPTDWLTCSLNLVASHPGIFTCDIWIARIACYRRFTVSSRARQLLSRMWRPLPACTDAYFS